MVKWVKSLLSQKPCVSNGSASASQHTGAAGWQHEEIRFRAMQSVPLSD